jgi:hypothetical protein
MRRRRTTPHAHGLLWAEDTAGEPSKGTRLLIAKVTGTFWIEIGKVIFARPFLTGGSCLIALPGMSYIVAVTAVCRCSNRIAATRQATVQTTVTARSSSALPIVPWFCKASIRPTAI